MQRAGDLASGALAAVSEHIRPGVSTAALDEVAQRHIEAHGGHPSFKGYLGFPGNICTSVNAEVVHGIPSSQVVLKEGDTIGIDLGAQVDGMHADIAATFPVGKIDSEASRLLRVTREACLRGIRAAVSGKRLGDVSRAIQRHVEQAGFSVVRDLVGHGIGHSVHEEPRVPNFYEGDPGPELKPGMALAIEPMVNAGDWRVRVANDHWTVLTADGGLSAHFEHTVIVRPGRPLVVTRWPAHQPAAILGRVASGG